MLIITKIEETFNKWEEERDSEKLKKRKWLWKKKIFFITLIERKWDSRRIMKKGKDERRKGWLFKYFERMRDEREIYG